MIRIFIAAILLLLIFQEIRSDETADFVNLQGFVPQGISPAFITYEYERIFQTLAPDMPLSRSPLYVIYFSRKMMPEHAYWLPEWGGGGAIGSDTIVVAVDAEPLLEQNLRITTVHELAHIVIKRIAPRVDIPRWFHEGSALLLSGDITWREQVVISQAMFAGSLLALDSIEKVNRFGAFKARLAYAQSRLAIQVLVDTYGMEVLSELLDAADSSGSFSSAIYNVLGLTPAELENMIRTEIHKRSNPLIWLADSYLLWIGIVLLFLLGFVVTRVRNRKKALQMEREEARESRESRDESREMRVER
ncbi:MAG: peptidase MA family metallohydrolase [Chitinispirillaceae bacterium]